MTFELWRGAPPCARCGCLRYFSVLGRDCLEAVTLADVLDYERNAA